MNTLNTLMNEARTALMQRRSSLRELQRINLTELGGQRSGREPDPVDGAGEEHAETVRARLSEREAQELRDIDDALVRIEQGRFGYCARCGGAVGRHRLRAIPEARHCLACSEQVGR